MSKIFNPSINIERDQDTQFRYIPTPNAEKVIHEIDFDYQKGISSFNIIGSFGTGKSAFLLAFNKHLTAERIFKTKADNLVGNKYSIINIVSKYESIETLINNAIKKDSKKDFLENLEKVYQKNKRNNFYTLIICDEFGKVLEYSAKNNPENELNKIQRLAEFVNDHKKDFLFISTLHQGFDSYSIHLNQQQRDEWTKVKGRFKEITFNEPVEQLLHLAAEKINNGKHSPPNFKRLLSAITESKVFQLRSINENIAKKLFPIDILTAGTLTLALQRLGQNERSLFTFLNSSRMTKAYESKGYFNLCDLYDYLVVSFSEYLNSKYNTDFINWQAIRNSLQRAYSLFDDDLATAEMVIKIIGLLTIFGSKGAKLNKKFLRNYLLYSAKIDELDNTLELLEKYKIIRFQGFKDSYVLFDGTDFEIEYELKKAELRIDKPKKTINYLKKYFTLNPVSAKEYYYHTGTPRYFNFTVSEDPIVVRNNPEYDGEINIVINSNFTQKSLKNLSESITEPIIFVLLGDSDKIDEHIFEIEKIKYLIDIVGTEDLVAKRELKKIFLYHKESLNEVIDIDLFSDHKSVSWIYKGKKIALKSKFDFNKLISRICHEHYYQTPTFQNELVNRAILPSNISRARRVLMTQLFDHWDENEIGFNEEKYPPEKSIYLALLKHSGIHRQIGNGKYILSPPNKDSFVPLWNFCANFLIESKVAKKNLLELIEKLQSKPFGLKKGFLDYWISIWLFINKADYALYKENIFIPELSNETIDLILKKPSQYYIKSFDLGEVNLSFFNKYRELINKESEDKISNVSFIDTIKPFLILYKSLSPYSIKTKRISKQAINLRNAIKNAKDPESTFFSDFPSALGYNTSQLVKDTRLLEEYFSNLKLKINELRTSYDNLLNRIEDGLREEFSMVGMYFPEYQQALQKRYSAIKKYSLLPVQKIYLQRINSKLDERDAWINSLVQSLIGKQLVDINDSEEELIYEKFRILRAQFDNLSEFVNLDIDNSTEQVIKLEVTSLTEGFESKIIRIPKAKNENFGKLKSKLEAELAKTKNKNERIYLLLKMLKEQINDEKS